MEQQELTSIDDGNAKVVQTQRETIWQFPTKLNSYGMIIILVIYLKVLKR